MKEQRKGYNAGVEQLTTKVKQIRNTEKPQFVLQKRGVLCGICEEAEHIHPVQTIFTTQRIKSCLRNLKSSFHKDL